MPESPRKVPVLRKWHIHEALRRGVAHLKEEEEAQCGEGWRSTMRECLEDALEALNEGRMIDVRMWDD